MAGQGGSAARVGWCKLHLARDMCSGLAGACHSCQAAALRLTRCLPFDSSALPCCHPLPARCRAGRQYNTVREVRVPAAASDAAPGAPLFQSSGVRKAVALARLVDALQAW